MNQSKISVRYAKALYEYAVEKNVLDAVVADVKMLTESFAGISQLREVFENPVVKPSQKRSFVDSLLKGKVSDTMLSFLHMVITNKRENCIQDILRNLQTVYRREKGITAVTLTSAVPLSEKQKNEIIDFVKKKEKTDVELQAKIDPSIMGGFILRVEDMQYDASISTRLQNVKKELTANK